MSTGPILDTTGLAKGSVKDWTLLTKIKFRRKMLSQPRFHLYTTRLTAYLAVQRAAAALYANTCLEPHQSLATADGSSHHQNHKKTAGRKPYFR